MAFNAPTLDLPDLQSAHHRPSSLPQDAARVEHSSAAAMASALDAALAQNPALPVDDWLTNPTPPVSAPPAQNSRDLLSIFEHSHIAPPPNPLTSPSLPHPDPEPTTLTHPPVFAQPDFHFASHASEVTDISPPHSIPPPPPPVTSNLPNPPSVPVNDKLLNHAIIPSLPPTLKKPSDGLSAVERAKRSAEDFTMSQLAKKRHKGNPALSADLADNSPKSSASDEAVDENHPESVSHRKYQKRLQKNRDSAFVSRIRRREYTRVLEETLNTIEKEKESAVNCLLDMKTRFEIVCAELAGMKNAALSNMATMGASVRTRLSASDDQTPGPPASTSSSDTHAPRSGTVTTMFMMALMFGVLMPNLVSRPPHAHGPESPVHRTHSFGRVLMSTRKPGDATLKQPAVALSTNAKRPNGRLWGIPSAPHAPAESDTECEQDLIADICRDVRDVLGAETSVVQQFMNVVKRYIESLSMDEVALLIDELKRLDVHDVHLSKVGKIETVLAKVDDGHTDDESGLLRDVERQLANTRLSNESEC